MKMKHGKKFQPKPWDFLYIPIGASITFSDPNCGLGFFGCQRDEGEV